MRELESSSNPFAVVVMAHPRTMETRKDDQERLRFKLSLSKSLYRRGWKRQEIINLYRFIDWIMGLRDDLEIAYHRELTKYEEEIKMPYVTTAERIGMEKGMEKGREKGREEGKKETARNLLLLDILTEGQIAQAAELSVEEVRKLRKEIR